MLTRNAEMGYVLYFSAALRSLLLLPSHLTWLFSLCCPCISSSSKNSQPSSGRWRPSSGRRWWTLKQLLSRRTSLGVTLTCPHPVTRTTRPPIYPPTPVTEQTRDKVIFFEARTRNTKPPIRFMEIKIIKFDAPPNSD